MSKDLIKQDINFLENPIWFQDGRYNNVVGIEGETLFVWKDREGFVYRSGYKIPTRIDRIFLLYLLKKSQNLNWNTEISLTRYEILRACDLNTKGNYWYERLEDGLERWKMVGIKFEGTFYDGKTYSSMNFGIIDSWDINKDTKELKVWLSPRWITILKESKYYKVLDFDEMKSVRSPLALRLYEILIKTFQNREVWQIDAAKLAAKIPLQKIYPAHIVPKIKAAVKTIRRDTELELDLEVQRPKRGKAILIFRQISKERIQGIVEEEKSRDMVDILSQFFSLLPNEEKSKKTIRDCIKKTMKNHSHDYVKRNILYTNTFAKTNYGLFLRRSLNEDWAFDWWNDLENKDQHPEKGKTFVPIKPNHFKTLDETHAWLFGHLEEVGKVEFLDYIFEKVKKGYAGNPKIGGYNQGMIEQFIHMLP